MEYENLPLDLQAFVDRGMIDLKMAGELTTLRILPADSVAHLRYGDKGQLLTPAARLKAQKEKLMNYKSVPRCCCDPRMNYESRNLPDAWEEYKKGRDDGVSRTS